MVWNLDRRLADFVLFGSLIFVAKKLSKSFQRWKVGKMLKYWENSPIRDKVILHSIWRCKRLPSTSPFGLKLETFLRMTNIPYELDSRDPIGPKGTFPWITFNGIHVTESHLCIDFLNRQFAVNLNSSSLIDQLAVARACRVMLEEHFIWGILQYRIHELSSVFSTLSSVPAIYKLFTPLVVNRTKKKMHDNGLGKCTSAEIYQMTEADLITVSAILGNKKFMGGDVPCEEDCAIFGMIAQAVWGLPGSSFEILVHGELSNLANYCERMKTLYWPDWNECLAT